MSWLINFQVLNLGQPLVAQIWKGLNRLFEPVFRPVRNILPNTHPLDLAPLAVFILIIALRDYFLPSLYLPRLASPAPLLYTVGKSSKRYM